MDLDLKKATERDPKNEEAWFWLGNTYAKLGQNRDAIEAYKQAIRIKPDYVIAHSNLALAYLHYGAARDRGNALEQYKTLKSLDKDRANKLFNEIYK